MRKKILKVGLDLDGVILYNPARIARPLIAFFKKIILGKKKTSFYLPQSAIEKKIWQLFHKSSIFVASGFEDYKKMAKKKQIKAYIITARYNFLKDDFEKWLKKINAAKYFAGCYYNKKNEQPNIFKEKMIKKLNLDIFVEDNWDIVKYLYKKFGTKTKIFWIYNLFDKGIKYQYKFPSLNQAIQHLKKIK